MDSRAARVARGLTAAVVSTLVAAVSHAAGGGVFPHLLLLLAGLVFSGLFCIALVGRRPRLARVIPSVLGAQLLFHIIFSITGEGAATSGTGHSHHGGVLVTTDAADAAALSPDVGMIAAHLAAAAVTIAALRFGEAAFWGLLQTARLMLSALLRFVEYPLLVLPAPSRTPAARAPVVSPLPVQFVSCLRRRGPPQPAATLV